MPSTYTSRARFTLQATGENFNTWGNLLNTQDFQLIDDSIAGLYAFTLSGPITLTANQGAADQSRMAALNITGGSGGVVTIPAVSKLYVVKNQGTGNAIFQPSGSASTVNVYPGEMVQIATDGANIWRVHAVNFDGQQLNNLGTPANASDAATKSYVDTAVAGVVVGPFPPMAGNAGKFIGTDGNNPAWSTTSTLAWQLAGLKLGGQTSAFPYLKQNGAAINVRLADDSGDALLTAASPPAGDSSQNVATTAWVKSSGINYAGPYNITGSSSLTPAAAGSLQVINATGITTTLPQISTMKPGQAIHFIANGSSSLISPYSGDNLIMNNATYNAGISIGLGDWLEVVISSGNWVVVAGTPGIFGSAGMQNSNFSTPPQFTSNGQLATTNFVQRGMGNHSNNLVVSGANQTLTPANCGQFIILAGSTGYTLTLPLAASCTPGASIYVQNTTSLAWVISRQGSDAIFTGQGFPTTLTIEGWGGWVELIANPSNNAWYASGSSMLGNSAWFTHAFGTVGYQQLPGGLFFNWCQVAASATAGAATIYNWPNAFPTNYGPLFLTGWVAGGSPMANCHGYNTSRTQFSACCILANDTISAFSPGN